MLHITFEYCDEMSGGEWRQQECVVSPSRSVKSYTASGLIANIIS